MRRPLVLAALATLAGCRSAPSAPPPLFATAASGAPVSVAADGGPVMARQWTPAGAPRSAVLVLPDAEETGALVIGLAERLAADGALVLAAELTAAPAASPARGASAAALVSWLRAQAGAAPLFVVGRGDAGLVALRLAQQDPGAIAGVAVVAPHLTGDHVFLMTGAVSVTALRSTGGDPRVRLWDEVGALDQPLLVVVPDEPRAIAVGRDLIDRSRSSDRAVRTSAEPLGAPAVAEVAAWIAQHAAGAVSPGRPAPGPRGGLGLAVGLSMGWSGTRREGGDWGSDLHTRGLLSYGAIGWAGVLDQDDAGLALMPIGLGARIGTAGQLALVGGIGVRTATEMVPVEASAELPLGRHLRGLATARLIWDLDDPADDGLDDIQVRVGLRAPGDRYLWRRVAAGGGLYLAGTYRRAADDDVIGIEIGYHLWGGQ